MNWFEYNRKPANQGSLKTKDFFEIGNAHVGANFHYGLDWIN